MNFALGSVAYRRVGAKRRSVCATSRFPLTKLRPRLFITVANVRFGSLADLTARLRDVCFTPDSGRQPWSMLSRSRSTSHSIVVPELTLCFNIKLNERVLLRPALNQLSIYHRAIYPSAGLHQAEPSAIILRRRLSRSEIDAPVC